ncbi:Linear gramicidin synthase subunit B [Enhygromyxa salina]|uniref:Linear gramicidin synthase subunit B n=1 Tax=Enhygromyxa salina TaxID=215803 RepID=A0A2S9XWY8_9BACT|nr:Linear gramicidin synthase subunit B [Enhygromyxa salina]
MLDERATTLLRAVTSGAKLLELAALVASTQLALARFAGTDKVIVGTPPRIDGERRAIANTIPLVQSLTADLRFRDLLSAARRSLLDGFASQDEPCGPTLAELSPSRALIHVGVALDGLSGDFEPRPEIIVHATSEAERVRIRVDAPSYAGAAVQAFGALVVALLDAGVTDHGRPLTELPPAPRVDDGDGVTGPIPPGTVLSRFEHHAALRPDAPALAGTGSFGDGPRDSLSYGALDRRAAALARALEARGVGPEVRVALLLDDPADQVIALLAVLKARGAYVPLDPDYPDARLAKTLADARPLVTIVEPQQCSRLPPDTPTLVIHDHASAEPPTVERPDRSADLDHLAYVIYTSGSTGAPRGVAVTHRGLANAIHQFAEGAGIDARDRVSRICSFCFDASVLETFLALTRGAALCLAPRHAWRRAARPGLASFLREQEVSVIGAITPAVLALVEPEQVPAVRVIHVGAARCSAELADRWGPGRRFVNCYGPTEATIDCMAHVAPGGEGPPPIGAPIANARVHVLDEHMRPVPDGVVGELYVGGLAVTRGYDRLPRDTALSFVPDPFSPTPGGRLYKTGDRGRRRPAGVIEFCGRVDRQIKLDGVRVELGEIEAPLRRYPGVRDVVVELRGDDSGAARLVAWLVVDGPMPSTTVLREHLAVGLPNSMLPSVFVQLDQLPLTANGKIDRAALPEPEPERPALAVAFAEPQTEVERVIAASWKTILGVEQVGLHDSFFDLGGRSLQVTQVMSKLAKTLHVELPLGTMFEQPSLAGLAAAVEAALAERRPDHAQPERPAPTASARPAVLPLSSPQRRLWLMHHVLPPGAAALYNGPVPVRLRGPLDRDALVASFRDIVARHEILRTAFRMVGDEPAQVILDALPVELPVVDLSGLDEPTRLARTEQLADAEAQRPFDLEQPPLWRLRLVILGPRDHVLLLNIHHILFDGWSAGVLRHELARNYAARSRGEPSPLAPLPLQYADFALWQQRELDHPRIEAQLRYWQRQLAELPELRLPTDRPRPDQPSYRGAIEAFRVEPELRDALFALSREAEATLFMTLLAAFVALLTRYSDQDDIVLSSPVANRNRAELEPLIGFFVNSLVLRVDSSGTPSFRELLTRVRQVTLDAYDHQDAPFERLVELLRPERRTTHNPLFRAAFSVQNTVLEPESPPGLTISPWQTHSRTAKFDLVLALTDDEEGLLGDVEYSCELFDRATILTMIGLYHQLLAAIVEHPDRRVLDLQLDLGQDGGPSRAAAPTPPRASFDFSQGTP